MSSPSTEEKANALSWLTDRNDITEAFFPVRSCAFDKRI